MLSANTFIVITLLLRCHALERRFPSGFKFGSASSAYQVEGAWNASDKGESIWDRYAHEHPDVLVNGNGDVATDSYHLWKEDVKIAHELGLHFYRFSISWPRILPTGLPNVISETGKKYYSNLIDGLLHKGIEPVVTLYHWDLPQKLQDLGGWTNPLISDWFADYARVVFSLYADRVKTWITINEPILICDGVYNMLFTAPAVKETELAPFLCNKHTLIAHAKAWRIYDTEYRHKYHDKGESIWDRYAHEHPDVLVNGNGDVATDSYHLWKEDVKIAHELGLHFYRFSISWPRILPTGLPNVISETGKKYYSNLIDGLLHKGIEPVVTLYHWDLPQKLQDLGGWTNPLISDWFADYARVVFSLYADRVKTWITINEPILICDGVYNMLFTAPAVKETELAPFLCNKHTLIAHAKAWRIYDTEYRHKYHGKVSITNNLVWMEPLAPEYKDLAELALQHCAGRYAHPIFSKHGGWPPTVEKAMAEYSRKQGHVRSRLPAFTEKEKHLIRGTHDFFAMNIYTSRLVRPSRPGDGPRIWFITGSPELNVTLEIDPKWKVGAISIMPSYPVGMRRQIAWLRKEYGKHLPILITENGYATFERDLYDEERIEYITDHLEQILLSIHEDGANVTGYSVWSLTDNFEWMAGYKSRFGLYDVDFEDPMRRRTARASAHFYKHLIRTRRLDAEARECCPRTKYERQHTINNSGHTNAQRFSILWLVVITSQLTF